MSSVRTEILRGLPSRVGRAVCAATLSGCCSFEVIACARGLEQSEQASTSAQVAVASSRGKPARETEERPSSAAATRFLIIGGGPFPESNEVSVEQDVELVKRALPGPGIVLFAGGGEAPTVRELAPEAKGDDVKLALGDFFAPRPGRGSRYRAPRFAAEPATFSRIEQTFSRVLSGGETPLLVYLAGHGEKGETPDQNSLALWGGRALSVGQLAAWHELHQRPIRLVATTCFSGGFGELAFERAKAARKRPAPVARCGVFAGTADRETSGCDPNPSRRAQESYGLHLTHALSGLRKDGSGLPRDTLDLNRDGQVGLLDAHTWARIQAASFDVPTTTSERWLRAVESGSAPIRLDLLPEDAAVVDQLGSVLELPTEAATEARFKALEREIAALNDDLHAAEKKLHLVEDELATALLERWPVIDDPYHPEFDAVFSAGRSAIADVLFQSELARKWRSARQKTDESYHTLDGLLIAEARVLRLLRAYETLHKAAALERRGGAEAAYYRELLGCERQPL